ncbi:hypothetical protein DYH09_12650 [bacterium CPR1]|nr:hypothetical protein [bacterium CPR1]
MLCLFRPEVFRPRQEAKKPEPRPEQARLPEPLYRATFHVGAALLRWGVSTLIQQVARRQRLEGSLLRLARQRQGILSLADATSELRASWSDCEAVLSTLARRGVCYQHEQAYIFEQHLPRLWYCDYCDGVHNKGTICCNCGAALVERACQVVGPDRCAVRSAR